MHSPQRCASESSEDRQKSRAAALTLPASSSKGALVAIAISQSQSGCVCYYCQLQPQAIPALGFCWPVDSLSLGARPPAKSHRFAPHFNSLTHFESLDFDVSSGSISCCLPGLPSSTHCRTHAHPSAYPNLLHSPFLSLSLPSTALDLSWSRSRLTTFPSIPISRPAAEPTAPHSGSYHETTALKGIRAHKHPSMSNRTQCG